MNKYINIAGIAILTTGLPACQTVTEVQSKVAPEINSNTVRNIPEDALRELNEK